MYLVYSLALALGFAAALPWFVWTGRASRYWRTLADRRGRVPAGLAAPGPAIWIHAVSVGEVLTARTLLAPLRARFPGHRLVLSTTTLTGQEVARQSLGEAVDGLFFSPFDWPGPVRRVLDAVNPVLLVLVETELWPNLIHESHRRGIRVAVVNGRLSPRSFPRYRLVRPLLRRVLAEVDLFLMQGEPHAARALAIGAPPERVRVTGNLKYDALGALRTSEQLAALVDPGRARPVWVAGSTVEGEEEIVLRAFRRVREARPETALILAPRHPERFGHMSRLVEAAGLRAVRRTSLQPGAWADGEVLVLDTLGELAQVYPMAAVVFVGGSLKPSGGHNILEAAVAGKPVLVGPHMENFQEIADEFRAAGALVQVRSGEELGEEVVRLLADPERCRDIGERGRLLVEKNRGARDRTVQALAGLVA